MKLLVVLALAVAVASAAPQQRAQQQPRQQPSQGPDVQILRYEVDNNVEGSYQYAVEQSDGQKQEATGQLTNAGTENEAIAVKGSYEWVGPDGVLYSVTYIADENGFQPTIEQGPGGAVPGAVVASLLG